MKHDLVCIALDRENISNIINQLICYLAGVSMNLTHPPIGWFMVMWNG